jgi:hypothetical protein
MKKTSLHAALTLALSALILAACGGAGGTPPASTALQQTSPQIVPDAALRNLSGQYGGTIIDKPGGMGKLSASLAQYKSAMGGSFRAKSGTSTKSYLVAFSISTGNTLGGTIIFAKTPTCTLITSAKYDTKTLMLSGKYKALNGCTGESGTYAVKQKCYYVLNGAIRPENGLKQC